MIDPSRASRDRRVAVAARFHELVRYGLVGLLNAATYVGLYAVLIAAGIPYVVAAVVAFPLPVALGYWLHDRWTFRRGHPTTRGLAGFLAVQVAALGLGLAVLIGLVDGLRLDAIVARVISTPLAPLFTYFVGRMFLFNARPSDDVDAS